MLVRLTAFCLLSLPSLAHAQPARVGVTVVVSGAARGEVQAALREPTELPVDTSFAELPGQVSAAPAPADGDLAAARQAYINAEFDVCLRGLEDDARVHAALAAGRRDSAARVLFWRVACHVGAADAEGARRAASRFATFGLEVPSDAEAASPEVEAVLAAALDASASAVRAPLRVQANTPAAVSIDGRPPGCEAPCALDVALGDHVVTLSAPGFADAWRLWRVEGPGAEAQMTLEEASPELAGAQWAARYVGREGRDSPPSVRLLSRAVRARRLVLMLVDPAAEGAHLRGVLAIDGHIAARAERTSGEVEVGSVELLRELLVQGGAVAPGEEVWESPWFWIGLGAAAAAAAGITAGVLVDRGTQTRICFDRPCGP